MRTPGPPHPCPAPRGYSADQPRRALLGGRGTRLRRIPGVRRVRQSQRSGTHGLAESECAIATWAIPLEVYDKAVDAFAAAFPDEARKASGGTAELLRRPSAGPTRDRVLSALRRSRGRGLEAGVTPLRFQGRNRWAGSRHGTAPHRAHRPARPRRHRRTRHPSPPSPPPLTRRRAHRCRRQP